MSAPEHQEVEVNYEADDLGLKVHATLGEATITVEHGWEAGDDIVVLVQALPSILTAVQEALPTTPEEA